MTKAPEGNVLKFRFQAKGLVPKKNILDGGISFLDEKTENLVATLEAPNMNDHTGKAYSENLSYDIESDGEEGSYLLTPVSYTHLDVYKRQHPVPGVSQSPSEKTSSYPGCIAGWLEHRDCL